MPIAAAEHPREWNTIMSGLPFADIRERGGYYVDKTLLIKDLIDTDANGVFLFTRPQAFGKSLNLTMLDAFFNIEHSGNTWFDGLEISNCPEYGRYKSAFPVIRLDLGCAREETYEDFICMMRTCLRNCFEQYRYLLESESTEESVKEVLLAVYYLRISEDGIKSAIVSLSRALAEKFGVNPIILIDDYDRPISKHFGSESHAPIMRFLTEFLRLSIDGNPYRGMVCIMGVMPIDVELKDVIESNILSGGSSDRFGFTESEAGKVLEDFGYPDGLDLMKEWHGGYRFGDAEVLNPCCVIRYGVEMGEQYLYWTSSSSLASVRHMVRNVSCDHFIDVLRLVTGGSILSCLEQRFSYGSI